MAKPMPHDDGIPVRSEAAAVASRLTSNFAHRLNEFLQRNATGNVTLNVRAGSIEGLKIEEVVQKTA